MLGLGPIGTLKGVQKSEDKKPAKKVSSLDFDLESVDSALIQGQYKIVSGHQGASGFWTGKVHPNGTKDPARNESACGAFACCEGCLYDIHADETEHSNLRDSMPQLFAKMVKRLAELGNTTYQTSYIAPGTQCLSATQAKDYYKGFRGPQCFNTAPPKVPTPSPTPAIGFQLVKDGYCLISSHKFSQHDAVPCGAGQPPLVPQWSVSDKTSGELCSTATGLCLKMNESVGWSCANTDPLVTNARLGTCGSKGGAHKSNHFFFNASAGSIESFDCPGLCIGLVRNSSEHGQQQEELRPPAHQVALTACADEASTGWAKRAE